MKRFSVALALIISIASAAHVLAKEIEDGRSSPGAMKYSWASAPIEADLWDMALGDIDSDGKTETVLLSRREMEVGALGGKGFERSFSCGWKAAADAARVSLIDLDADGKLEAAISAVESGMPSSIVLKIDTSAGKCREIVSNARYSIRAIDVYAESGSLEKRLAGQEWNAAQFFSGPVRVLELSGDRLAAKEKVDLPRNVSLFQFTMLPYADGNSAVAVLKGASHMEVYVSARKGKWKRVWRSGERLGGTSNALVSEQRPALDQVMSDLASFDIPPVVSGEGMVAVKADMPVHDIVGRQPYVRGGEAVAFARDPGLTYVESWRTQWLPGEVASMALAQGAKLALLLKNSAGAFENATGAKVMEFQVSNP